MLRCRVGVVSLVFVLSCSRPIDPGAAPVRSAGVALAGSVNEPPVSNELLSSARRADAYYWAGDRVVELTRRRGFWVTPGPSPLAILLPDSDGDGIGDIEDNCLCT